MYKTGRGLAALFLADQLRCERVHGFFNRYGVYHYYNLLTSLICWYLPNEVRYSRMTGETGF